MTLDERIRRAENERKDAIENGDRKGRWYAEGKIDALKALRIEHSIASGAQSDREVAIGEHAFKAGWHEALVTVVPCMGEYEVEREAAWSEYTPPENLL